MLLINVLLFHPNLLFTVYAAIIEMDPVMISLEPAGSMSSLSGEGATGTLPISGLHFLQVPTRHNPRRTRELAHPQ